MIRRPSLVMMIGALLREPGEREGVAFFLVASREGVARLGEGVFFPVAFGSRPSGSPAFRVGLKDFLGGLARRVTTPVGRSAERRDESDGLRLGVREIVLREIDFLELVFGALRDAVGRDAVGRFALGLEVVRGGETRRFEVLGAFA